MNEEIRGSLFFPGIKLVDIKNKKKTCMENKLLLLKVNLRSIFKMIKLVYQKGWKLLIERYFFSQVVASRKPLIRFLHFFFFFFFSITNSAR